MKGLLKPGQVRRHDQQTFARLLLPVRLRTNTIAFFQRKQSYLLSVADPAHRLDSVGWHPAPKLATRKSDPQPTVP